MGLKCRDGPTHGKYSWKRSHKRTISFPLAKSRKEQKHYQGFCSCFSWCRDPRLWDPTPYKHSRSSIGRGSWWIFATKCPFSSAYMFSSIALLAAKVDWRSAAPCGYGGVYARGTGCCDLCERVGIAAPVAGTGELVAVRCMAKRVQWD